jgi:fibronectin-binding autotransporter adhesin
VVFNSNNGAALTFNNAMTYTHATTLTTATVFATGANNVTASGVIGGAANLTKTGSGTLLLSNANTNSGTKILQEGTLEVSNSNALGSSGAVTIGNASSGAANLSLYLTNNRTSIARAITISNLATGTVTLGSRASIGGSGDDNQFTNIVLQRDVVFDSNAADRTDYENISGTGNVTVQGAQRSIFMTANTFTGSLTVSNTGSGRLQLGANSAAFNAIPDSSAVTVSSGARLSLSYTSGGNETIGSLSGTGTVDNNGGGTNTLTVGSGGGSGSFGGSIQNGGGNISLAKTGTGTQTLTGTNTYTGSTTVNQGTISLTGSAVLGGASGSTSDTNNIVFGQNLDSGRLTFETSANLGAAGQVRFRNTGGTAGQGGALVYTGTTAQTVSKTLFSDSSIGIRLESDSVGGAVTFNGAFSQTNRPLYLGGTGTGANTMGIAFTGTGAITKRDGGTWRLTGSNTHSGGTTINGGVLELNAASASWNVGIFGGTATINNGGTMKILGGNNTGSANTVNVNGGGTLEFTQSWNTAGAGSTYLGTINLSSASGTAATVNGIGATRMGYNANGTITSTGATANTFSAGLLFVNNGTFTVTISPATGNTLNFTGMMSDHDGLAGTTLFKTGGGTMILASGNTRNGANRLQAGTTEVSNTSAFGNGGYLGLEQDATLRYTGTGTQTDGRTLWIDQGTQAKTIEIVNAAANLVFTSNAGNVNKPVTKTGAGTITIADDINSGAALTVSAGTFRIGNLGANGNLASGASAAVSTGANLEFANSGSITIGGGLSGAGTIRFQGTGVSGQSSYTLGGTSTHTGAIVVDEARITLDNATDVGSASMITVNSGAGVYVIGGTIARPITISGNGWTEGSGDLGAIRMSAGTWSGAVTLASNSRLHAHSGETSGIISGVISDGASSFGVTKTGVGTLTLSGANTYDGVTTVSEGTLKVGSSRAFGAWQTGRPVTQVVVASGAAVDYNGAADATYGYTISGTGVGGTGALTNSGGGIGNGSAQASNILLAANASIGGSGNWSLLTNSYNPTSLDLNGNTLTKVGANTINLVSTTTTAGTVNVTAGGLGFGVTNGGSGVVGAASAFTLSDASGVNLSVVRDSSAGSLGGGGTSGGNVSISSGVTLTTGALGTSTTLGGVVSGAGNLTKTGAGTWTLGGANTYTGNSTINGGTLEFSSNSNQTLSGAVSGVGNLVKSGTGTLTLPGNKTHTGATTISGGVLTASGAGTFNGTSALSVGSGATFNYLPGTIGSTMTMGAGSTLTLASNSIVGLNWDASTASKIVAAGAATIGSNVKVSMTGAYTSGQSYTILQAGSGLDSGSYTAINNVDYTAAFLQSPTSVTITPTTVAPAHRRLLEGRDQRVRLGAWRCQQLDDRRSGDRLRSYPGRGRQC